MHSAILALLLGCTAAAAAGLVGAFALMRGTLLAGDVMSHLAIPGLGLAVLWRINPLAGGGLTLFAGVLLIWKLGDISDLGTEARIGVLFAASVALGALLIHSSEELMDALFGGLGVLTRGEWAAGFGFSVLILAVLWALRHRLVLALFAPDLAATTGVNVRRVNLWFLLLFALALLASLRFLGALLVGALVIVPASTARQLARGMGAFLAISMLAAVVAMLAGFYFSARWGLPLGPLVVMAATAEFVLSLLKAPA